jgi:hypothetical protein
VGSSLLVWFDACVVAGVLNGAERARLCVFVVDEVSTRLELWGLVFGADFGLCLL